MNNIFYSIAERYLNGKSIYNPFRRAWNILLSFSIGSFLFQLTYFKYEWIDVTDYKSILHYFAEFHFIAPVLMFAIAHFGLFYLSDSFFSLSTMRKKNKFIEEIIKYKPKKKDLESLSKNINTNPIVTLPVKLNETVWLKWYKHIKETVGEMEWKKAELEGRKIESQFENDFNLVFKTLVAVTIYFATTPYFGIWSYLCCIAILLILLIALWWLNVFVSLIPTLIKKADIEIQKYIQTHLPTGEDLNIIPSDQLIV